MFTIALVARKGGSGKTTIGVHLALAAFLRGLYTLVADADPQRSAIEALRARQSLGPERTGVASARLYDLQMSAVRQGTDVMVIDTPAGVAEECANAIVLADLCLLVVRPTYLDLAAAIESVAMIRRLKKPVLIVVNQAPPTRGGVEPPTVRRALRALAVLKQPVAPTIIRSRLVYQRALETGCSAEETGDLAATQEIAELWAYIHHIAFPRRVAG
ncbi:ParA family protein [Phenylobacterium sp.]|uniref:ParA family protein n=1 Tax=Phenylobacterium sp. TaxID=1871053 RepID=UPI002733B1E2|nr:ParA family protein [Phenylobacterium sp.]MDP3852926.1 ParA family protein [Phenylobacterium sp.]